ncbi:signal peptidase I [Geothrix oryzisoli]|uniref:signal peptidase I n=1 Tax=Geothrix oryzisoli TaxID=2922721 RepID=UPI001FACCEF9
MKPWIPLAALALALSPLAVVHPVRVSGRSMEPALHDGDLRWAVRAWASHAPRRGEVWLVEGPHGSSVKRVLGLPGEALTWTGPDLWIAGQRLDEPWVVHPERSGAGHQACGAGYLVLGDNRPDSQDGRSWGPLPVKAMRGRIL